jgi:hypothetical protein
VQARTLKEKKNGRKRKVQGRRWNKKRRIRERR